MTLADAEQTLSTGDTRAILALVVLALVVAMIALLKHHLATQQQCREDEKALRAAWDAERAAWLTKERDLQEARLGLSTQVVRVVEALTDLEERKA